MAERGGPQLFTIPAHRSFADALAAGLIRRCGGDPMRLARGIVLLPSNRAVRTIAEGFVRASAGGLILPRLVAIGDADIEEAIGAGIDTIDGEVIPPAVPPLLRRVILARLIEEESARADRRLDAGEAIRLAGELARTLDQLLVEEIAPRRLREIDLAPELSEHWLRALDLFSVVIDRWPAELARIGRLDLADRRGRLLDRLGQRWRGVPPAGFVCAAGITTAAPAIARLMRVVAGLPEGLVVMPGLATEVEVPDEEWRALGPHDPDPETGGRRRSIETHPQFQMKLLIDRMGFNRKECALWRDGGGHDATAVRGRAIANALAAADHTAKWTILLAEDRRLSGVGLAELATPAEEAQAIAIAMRGALETPGQTAALVTPDRALARRVAAHLSRWNIAVDDSAGVPLSMLPPGTFLLALAEAAAQGMAPPALLALLKHPLVASGDERVAWLEGVRLLDLALRGPRPVPGLAGIDGLLADDTGRDGATRRRARSWWIEVRRLLEPIEAAFAGGTQPPVGLLAVLRETGNAMCGDTLWSGAAGRMVAQLLADFEEHMGSGPPLIDPASLAPTLRLLMSEMAVRPPQGGHPRLAIYGLIEARLQTADLMILGGMNEGVWPGRPAPDPWLAPRIRSALGLPGLERRIGLAAHDLASGLGAPRVILTRARRDARSPTIASRFWLRLKAMSGDGLARADDLVRWARALDASERFDPAVRPAPLVPRRLRPSRISVTEVDRLKADPFAFYARRVLSLSPLDAVDADATAAWRGTAVHAILEAWAREDGCRPDALPTRARAMLAAGHSHPLLRALWQPRVMEAIGWIADRIATNADEGRTVLAVEQQGVISISGIELNGTFDRLDRLADGTLAVVDYKTGKPPSPAAVSAGYSMQLGLLGLMVERGGFAGIAGKPSAFEYWSLAKNRDQFGYVTSPVDPDGKRDKIRTEDFTTYAAASVTDAIEKWLTGGEPFTAKLHPEYAPFADYDQLMRLDEWYGR